MSNTTTPTKARRFQASPAARAKADAAVQQFLRDLHAMNAGVMPDKARIAAALTFEGRDEYLALRQALKWHRGAAFAAIRAHRRAIGQAVRIRRYLVKLGKNSNEAGKDSAQAMGAIFRELAASSVGYQHNRRAVALADLLDAARKKGGEQRAARLAALSPAA